MESLDTTHPTPRRVVADEVDCELSRGLWSWLPIVVCKGHTAGSHGIRQNTLGLSPSDR